MFRLTKREKRYTLLQWLEVVWLSIRQPIRTIRYIKYRRWTDREEAKSIEEKRADLKKIIERLKEQSDE